MESRSNTVQLWVIVAILRREQLQRVTPTERANEQTIDLVCGKHHSARLMWRTVEGWPGKSDWETVCFPSTIGSRSGLWFLGGVRHAGARGHR